MGVWGEFGSTGSSSKEEYDDYWVARIPIQVGRRSARFSLTGRGRSPSCPMINPDEAASSHDCWERARNPKRPRTKRGPKQEESEPVFATRAITKAGRNVHTAEEEYARSARSTVDAESVIHPDADVESSGRARMRICPHH